MDWVSFSPPSAFSPLRSHITIILHHSDLDHDDDDDGDGDGDDDDDDDDDQVSALLAFSAYMEQFPRQQDFLQIIPGMHRWF